MKKYSFILAAAAVSMLVACNKEQDMPVSKTFADEAQQVLAPCLTYISANGGENSVKSSIDDESAAFSWNTGDQIAVFSGDTYYVSQPLASTYDGNNAAVFAFDSDIESGRQDFAVYPANLVMNGTSVYYDSAQYHAADHIALILPESYKLADVQGEVSPTPMIAVNTSGSGLEFKSICALVRVTVKNIAWDTETIKVTFPGIRVTGSFDLYEFVAGTSGVEPTDAFEEGVDDTITITDLGISEYTPELVINVPIPMGVAGSYEYENVKVTACDASGLPINYIVSPLKLVEDVPTAWVPGRKSSRKVTANLPVFTVKGNSIEAADRVMVVFAPGNLRAKLDVVPVVTMSGGVRSNSCSIGNFGTASEWSFHEHQYDSYRNTIPEGREYSLNSLEESVTGDYTDLFCWTGSDAGSTLTKKGEAYLYGIFYGASSGTSGYIGATTGATLAHDWGENPIVYGEGTYQANSWRTPTATEWEFVLSSRKLPSTPRIMQGGKAMLVKSSTDDTAVAYGLIVLPDNYSHPYGVAPFVKFYEQNNKSYDATANDYGQGAVCTENVYTLEEWEKLEGAGCVFLPTTDQRNYAEDAHLQTNNPGNGIYWSSSLNKTSLATTMAFNCPEAGRNAAYDGSGRSNLQFKYSRSRYYNEAVRLVRDVKK